MDVSTRLGLNKAGFRNRQNVRSFQTRLEAKRIALASVELCAPPESTEIMPSTTPRIRGDSENNREPIPGQQRRDAYRKKWIANQSLNQFARSEPRRAFKQLRLKVIKIDRRQRLNHVKFTGFPVQSGAIPVKHPVGRVRVLLDFEDDEAGTDRVNPAAWKKHRVASLNLQTMETVGDGSSSNPGLEFCSRRTRVSGRHITLLPAWRQR